jgi:hypothetical protein
MLSAITAEPKRPRDFSPAPNQFKDIVDLIFSIDNREDALDLVEFYGKYFDRIIGTRGNTGDSITNANTKADELGVPPSFDLSDLKVIKKEEPVTNTFDSLFEV